MSSNDHDNAREDADRLSVSNARRADVVIRDSRATITFRRTLRHTIEHVWDAITSEADLAVWMLQSASIEPRVGGRIRYVSSPTPIVWYGAILVWDPPRVFEHEFNTDPDARWGEHLGAERTVARWELEAEGDSTVLTLTFTGFTPSTAAGFAPGTHAFLERLEAHLAHEPMPEWMPRFQALMTDYLAG